MSNPTPAERAQMEAAGFVWDPARGYARWTHSVHGTSVLRQPYMDGAQWDAARERCIELAQQGKC